MSGVPYKTISAPAQAEMIVKKSRFIATIIPAASPEEAAGFVDETKRRCWDASHNVWAYYLRGGQRRYSDDGEPQGTAGLPILDVLQKEGIENCAVVVTRYFGGTLLGAPGLARAYAGACKAAIEAADLVTMAQTRRLRVVCGYDFYRRLQSLVLACGGAIMETEFGELVKMTLSVAADRAELFGAKLADASNGTLQAECVWEGWAAISGASS